MDHVLNEIEDVYDTTIDYPVAEFIIMFGFFLIWFIETLFQLMKESQVRRQGVAAAAAAGTEEEEAVSFIHVCQHGLLIPWLFSFSFISHVSLS